MTNADDERAALEATQTMDTRDAANPVSDAETEEDLGPGMAVGRYVIEERVGAGGMGVVYAARDPELDRRVALKFLHRAEDGSDRGREERLRREAKAMAKLSHPNVATVYDVGTYRGRLFIAMEFIEGPTLREWLSAEERGWRETLPMFLDAGRGLAAAHGAGIVHRDFKPDNVIVGRDGPKVTDFGLARSAREAAPEPVTPSSVDAPAVTLTMTGSVLGTFHYMAPEQHRGERADVRADQFAFAVALYQALYRELPFEGETPEDYRGAVLAGTVRSEPRGADVPARVRTALLRSLRVEEDERFPDMDALLRELALRRSLRRRIVLASAAVVLGAAAAVGYVAQLDEDVCAGAGTAIEDVWNEPVRAEMRQSFARFDRPDAAPTLERVDRLLTDYAESWRSMRRDACDATHVRKVQSADMLDRRTACLDGRLADFRAFVDVVRSVDDDSLLERLVPQARELQSLAPCADTEALASLVPLPEDDATRERVASARAQLAEGRALETKGKYADGVALLREALEEARELDYAPLTAEALHLLGELLTQSGDLQEARVVLEEATAVAAQGHDDLRAAQIWARLLYVVGGALDLPREAIALQNAAEAAMLRAGSPAEVKASLWSSLGTAYRKSGDLDEAQRLFEEALTIARASGEPGRIAMGLNNLATAYGDRDDFEKALDLYRDARSIWHEELGPSHPRVAFAAPAIGAMLKDLGRFDEAAEELQHGLSILEATVGTANMTGKHLMNNLGLVERRRGNIEKSLEYYEHALAIAEEVMGPESSDVGAVLANMVGPLFDLQRFEKGIELLERVRSIADRTGNKQQVVASEIHLGNIYTELGRHEDAVEAYERGIQAVTELYGKKHPSVVYLHQPLALAYSASGRHADALAAAKMVLATIDTGADASPIAVADARFVMARVLVAAGRERGRALRMARQARKAFAQSEGKDKMMVDEVDRWFVLIGEKPR